MTKLINRFDIKYNMVKKNVGRKQKKVIESIPYSEIIFLVASEYNYALKISEARGRKDSSPTAKQLKQLEEKGFLKSYKEKLLNKTVYTVNWDRICQEFANYVFDIVINKRQQLKAYFGEKYNNYIKEQEQALEKREKELPKKAKEKKHNEEEAYKELEKLIKSKRLNKNKYLQILLETIFKDCSKVYVKNNIPISIKDIFEETKQSFGFENFDSYVWTRMLDIVLYKEPFPHKRHMQEQAEDWKKQQKEQDRIFKELQKRYDKLREDKDFQDIQKLETALRFAFWGFLVPNASWKMAQKLIRKNNLITEQEFEEYKKLNKKQENGFNATKPTENNKNKSGNTDKNKALSSESKEGEKPK